MEYACKGAKEHGGLIVTIPQEEAQFANRFCSGYCNRNRLCQRLCRGDICRWNYCCRCEP